MKKVLTLTLISILFLTSMTVYAKPGKIKKVGFVFIGPITKIEADAVTISVKKGNKHAKEFVGKEVSFTIDSKTKVDGKGKKELADLVTGDYVHINSKAAKNATKFTAKKINVQKKKKVKLQNYVFNGTIVEVGESDITIQVSNANSPGKDFIGKELVFSVADTTNIYLDDNETTLDQLAADQTVEVKSKAEKGAEVFKASEIKASSSQDDGGDDSPGDDQPQE